jgi:hypothetical protein
MAKIEKLSDYKRSMKAFVRGAIKAKLFGDEAGDLKFTVTKKETKEEKRICIETRNCPYGACFCTEVATRVFNKVVDGFFDATVEQFSKIKGINSITFTIVEAEDAACESC